MTVYATAVPSNNISVDALLDDMLGDLTTKPNVPDTPEDVFFNYFTGDKFGKVVILMHWIRQHGLIYDRCAEYNLCIATTLNKDGLKRVPFSRYARVLIEHYLMTSHPHWFLKTDIAGREPADMGKVIDRLMAVDKIKAEIFSENRT